LFGIFLQGNSEHIGNVKLEPILPGQEAILGILIGEEIWRGKGVGFEVIQAIIEFSFVDLGLPRLKLGVSQNNLAAYKLYKKLGFVPSEAELAPDLGIIMLLERK
jgi:RimJ/RimL family protein N-acetyltransferase